MSKGSVRESIMGVTRVPKQVHERALLVHFAGDRRVERARAVALRHVGGERYKNPPDSGSSMRFEDVDHMHDRDRLDAEGAVQGIRDRADDFIVVNGDDVQAGFIVDYALDPSGGLVEVVDDPSILIMRLAKERLEQARDLGRVISYRDAIIDVIERLVEEALTRRGIRG